MQTSLQQLEFWVRYKFKPGTKISREDVLGSIRSLYQHDRETHLGMCYDNDAVRKTLFDQKFPSHPTLNPPPPELGETKPSKK